VKKQFILSIDAGTTGITSLLLDVTQENAIQITAKHTVEFPQHFPKDGWVEHDLEQIWAATLSSMEMAIEKAGPQFEKSQIAGIGMTNQRETLAAFDRKTGQPLARAIVWQCRRSTDICSELRHSGMSELVHKATGLVLDPYFSATKAMWWMRHQPEVARALSSGRGVMGTIDAFLIHRLTGFQSFVTEPSNASRTMLFDLVGGWRSDLLRLFEIPSVDCLPEVRTSAGNFGKTKGLGILPDGIVIAGVLGDQQAALAGQTCFQEGEAKCTYGTGAFLLLNAGPKPVYSNHGLLTTIAWDIAGIRTYALEGSAFIAGAAVQFLRDQLQIVKHAGETERLAQAGHAAPELYFVPAFSGLGAPHWDALARGAFLGMHRGTTKADIIRAALEGIGFQVDDLMTAMCKDLGRPLAVLRVDGGAASNNFMMQFQSDLLAVTVDRPRDIETTAIGAALFAGLGLGIYRDFDDMRSARVCDQIFNPAIADAEKLKLMKLGWQRAVAAVQMFANLNIKQK
jgi:glycerol kinase